MNILLVNPFFWPYGGGIEYHVEQLVKHLGSEHDVSVITSKVSEPYEPDVYNVTRVPCLNVKVPLLSPPPFVFTPHVLPAIIKAAKKADLIHLHTRWYPDYVLSSVIAKKVSHKPLFFTAHEPARLRVDPLLDLGALANDLLFTKTLLRNAFLFSVSRAVADTFSDVFQKETLRVVYNGVDTKKFSLRTGSKKFKESVGLTSPYILFVGRLIKQKAVDHLIRAFVLAKTDLKLVIIGRGSEEPHLRALAEKLGAQDDVKFVTEFLDENTLVSAYAGCEFFVLPSVWEAFGIVLVEAMSCSRPCVGTDAGGIPEVIGDTGKVVPKGDVVALSREIKRMHEDKLLRKKLGTAARKRVLKRFTWEKMAQRTLEGYEEVVG